VNDIAADTYPPIEARGAIGDLHTVALVTTDGTIDWCCLPRFDSPAVFASLLDARRGGAFRLAAEKPEQTRQMYPRFTHSTVMTWVAFTRALQVAGRRGLPAPTDVWAAAAARAYHEVQDVGWDAQRRCYVQFPGANRLDAALLTMPLVGFVGGQDPRFLASLDAIERDLVTNTLVRRYSDDGWDGLDGHEGSFSLCTFWFVEALARAGRVGEARLVFEKMLTYANHLGLYSEEIGLTGEQLGNFPQAFTHLALISAAYNLDRALG
jgi:GH15 family glucan-1,4-alpha-glucosidase